MYNVVKTHIYARMSKHPAESPAGCVFCNFIRLTPKVFTRSWGAEERLYTVVLKFPQDNHNDHLKKKEKKEEEHV